MSGQTVRFCIVHLRTEPISQASSLTPVGSGQHSTQFLCHKIKKKKMGGFNLCITFGVQ